jgi:hypothetical protein
MESNTETRRILEEHIAPEFRGVFGGKAIEITPDGQLQRTTFVTLCDDCGAYPLNSFTLCRQCRKRLCSECSTKVDGACYCLQHLPEVIPMTRNSFKILCCINSGIDSVQEICKITKLGKDDVKRSIVSLVELKYIATKNLLTFFTRKITADGIRAVGVWSGVFSKDEDVIVVLSDLAEVNNNGRKNGDIHRT